MKRPKKWTSVATDQYLAALDRAALDEGSAVAALVRLVDVGRLAPRLKSATAARISAQVTAPESEERHTEVFRRITALARRGQRRGEFDDRVPDTWLAAATISLSPAAATEVAAGRLSERVAQEGLLRSLLRVFAVGDEAVADANGQAHS